MDVAEPVLALADYVWRRLFHPDKFRNFVERLTEPLHLNLALLFVAYTA